MLSTLKIRVKILALELIFVKLHFFLNLWRLELPNITGTVKGSRGTIAACDGAFEDLTTSSLQSGGTGTTMGFTFDASRISSIYNTSSTVQPESNQTLIIIKT